MRACPNPNPNPNPNPKPNANPNPNPNPNPNQVHQRQFLPLFPASADGSVPVDVSACLQRGALGARPHVLLVPSDLGPFAKAAD